MRNRQHGIPMGWSGFFYKFRQTNLSPVQPQAGSVFGNKYLDPDSVIQDPKLATMGPIFVT
jgi:hypothetical protein